MSRMVGKVGLETPGVMGAVPLPGTQEGRGHEHDDQQQSHSQSCGDTDEQLWQVRLLALLGALEKKCEGGCGWTPPPTPALAPPSGHSPAPPAPAAAAASVSPGRSGSSWPQSPTQTRGTLACPRHFAHPPARPKGSPTHTLSSSRVRAVPFEKTK